MEAPVSQVRIVTDSTSCLPEESVREFGLRVVPVGLVIEGTPYRDNVDITLAEICARFDKMEKQPSTSAGNPGDFLNVFTEFGETTDSILCILVSKALTATTEAAYQARRMMRQDRPELRIEVIDSKTSAGALGFVVLAAARAAAEGQTLDEVIAVTKDMISRVVYLSALDTLRYMINTGRAPKGITSVGEILNIKPIIGFVDDTGITEVVARVRGKRNSITKIVDLIDKYVDTDEPLHAMVHYSDSIADAEALKAEIERRYDCAEILVTPYTPVMVSATGPLTGVSVYS
jgi:DegV family protein with EDD domain